VTEQQRSRPQSPPVQPRPQRSPTPPSAGPAPEKPDYEPPRIEVLGTIAELTAGGGTHTTDGTFPGSVFR